MEKNAFEHQARSWHKKALSVSLSHGAERQEAEDIAQDVMLRLWQMHDNLEHYDSPDALITLMARHLLRNHQRRRKPSTLNDTNIIDLSTSPHQMLEMKEDEVWLEQKLRLLPTTQRTLMFMRQVERRSHKEIAQLLGIKSTSVATLLSKARHTLLDEIKQRHNL